jgi:ABC-type multidrug transport system fused ATPase/permease subunit
MASVERIFSILEWSSEPDLNDIQQEVEPYTELRGDIEFRNVWFAYEGEKWILKDFNFKAKAGEKIGIVGPTGSGKTTMINLLLRFYDPQRGEIFLDGKPLNTFDKRRLRASLGLIQQDVFLFSGSIAENMTLWRRFDPKVRNHLKSLKSFERLESMGLENATGLDERGGNLSMGERQILAFARALHTHPRLWILDEATANMDSQTEEELEHNLQEACSNQTMMTIAHRLASVKKADQILVLQHGVLVENGNHRELMAKKGLYSKLYEFQELS